jgi:hypothetical protein
MASKFSLLWADLNKLTPMTQARDTSYEKDRKEIMGQLGLLGGKNEQVVKSIAPRVQLNRHHGKKARAMENSAHQTALHHDSKADAVRRLEVQSIVHEVEAKNAISKELAKYVKAQQPIPPRLLKELTGAKLSRSGMLPPIEVKEKFHGYVPPPTNPIVVPRKVITMHAVTRNKWSAEERDYLVELYREMERPQGARVELWKIYYERLSERFRSLFPHRQHQEIADKLHTMIEKKQMHAVSEVEHWKKLGGTRAEAREKSSPSKIM